MIKQANVFRALLTRAIHETTGGEIHLLALLSAIAVAIHALASSLAILSEYFRRRREGDQICAAAMSPAAACKRISSS